MKAEILNAYAKRIEEAGLKQDLNPDIEKGLHHYVIAVEYTKENVDDVIKGMPDAFEGCYDIQNAVTKQMEAVSMFYLEDCTETDASTIESWLKANKNWRTYA